MKYNARLYDLPPQKPTPHRGRPRKRGKLLAKPEQMAAQVKDWQKILFRQRGKTAPGFADVLRCLRVQLWMDRIKLIFDVSVVHDKNSSF